jgi:hypothetical protein
LQLQRLTDGRLAIGSKDALDTAPWPQLKERDFGQGSGRAGSEAVLVGNEHSCNGWIWWQTEFSPVIGLQKPAKVLDGTGKTSGEQGQLAVPGTQANVSGPGRLSIRQQHRDRGVVGFGQGDIELRFAFVGANGSRNE